MLKQKITLPDSSVVWLNANACLRYPREFSQQIRQVEIIKGEAFFEVRKDEKKAFYRSDRWSWNQSIRHNI